DDTTGETLKTVVKNGVTNADANYSTKSDIQNYESQHYILVSDSSNGAELVFDNDDAVDQHYEVHLKHATHAIDEHHVINETVHYKMSDGTKAPDYYQAEALSFSRDGFNDEVTGIDHWNAWAPKAEQTFGKVVSPLVAGYTPDIDQINTQTVKPTDHDLEFTVTYTPNVQIAHVKYIDDTDHKVLTQDDLNGRTGETSGYHTTDRITEFKGQHYVFVSDNYPATGMTFDNNDRFDQIYEVHFKHGTRTDEQDVQVPRTIKYVYQNGQQAQPDHSDALKFHETKVVDLVDGHTVSDDWTPAQDFETVMTPEIQGYTPDHASVANTGIAHDHSAIVETVTYNPDAQKAVVKYIDDTTGEQLEAKDLAGVSDQSTGYTTKETIDGYINQHYVLVSDGTHGETVVFDHDDDADQSYEVHLKHGTEPANESRIKKITVHYQYADGLARSGKAADDQTATNLTFKRTGTHDLVTDKIAWNAWNHADQTFS
ncbi:mucin-binding protein, partial [Bacillus subtilis]|uniref:mucin-binding protein n=1 Tax=Bacillus subtilis TaxID=1423 RepID=UPI0023EE14AB